MLQRGKQEIGKTKDLSALLRILPEARSTNLRICDGSQLLILKLFNCFLVFSQVQLSANEDDGSTWTVMSHLGVPLRTM
jgi:hypothetical protein